MLAYHVQESLYVISSNSGRNRDREIERDGQTDTERQRQTFSAVLTGENTKLIDSVIAYK